MKELFYQRAVLSYSLILNFLSGFGQTFFISLFVPSILLAYSISESDFGLYYSLLTLLGALFLPSTCRLIEKLSWPHSSLITVSGLSIGALLVSQAESLGILILGLLLLRFLGQGLSTHMSSVCIVKNIPRFRGTALSIGSIGFPLSEAILPPLGYFMITQQGWQSAWFNYFIFLLACIPLFLILGFSIEQKKTKDRSNDDTHQNIENIKILNILRDTVFLKYLPAVLCAPFFMTGIFLYQTSISELKGWETQTLSLGFIAFAMSRLLFSILGGPFIDKISAIKIFPFYLAPTILGLCIIALFEGTWIAWSFMTLAGVSVGISSSLKSALWTELYGAQLHGRYRSVAASLMVISTALSPPLFGNLIENKVSVALILIMTAAIMAASSLLCLSSKPHVDEQRN